MGTIVISGINLFEGGPLSVYKDCLNNIIANSIHIENNIIAFVHKKELFAEFTDEIMFIELPKSRKSYLFRIWYEYVYFYFYSKVREIDIWISLHDITPNVKAKKRYVYCHNPSIFMKTELKNLKYSYKNVLFALFYKYLYKINIKKNTAIIVQQDWIRDKFKKIFKIEKIIVAKPIVDISRITIEGLSKDKKNKYQFIYPAYSRFFKNFEVICEASVFLAKKGIENFEVLLTIDGTENRYSYDLYNKYKAINNIKFMGAQKREKVFALYEQVDCLLFPSKLETWGLPISEFKQTGKSILTVDLPYARETMGNYRKACFFHPNDSKYLAYLMELEIRGENIYTPTKAKFIKQPYADNWRELLEQIIE